MNVQILSKVLFDLDLARTCCKENLNEDEYIYTAHDIANEYADGERDLFQSIGFIFEVNFEVSLSATVINTIIENYNQKLQE